MSEESQRQSIAIGEMYRLCEGLVLFPTMPESSLEEAQAYLPREPSS